MLQVISDGRMDLTTGRGNTGPVYPWFGQDIRQGIPLAIENYALLRRLWEEDVVDWQGKFLTPLAGLHIDPAPPRRAAVRAGTAPSAAPRSPSRPPTTAMRFCRTATSGRWSTPRRWSTASATSTTGRRQADQAIGLGGQVFMSKNSQDAVTQFGLTSTTRPSTGTDRRWRTSCATRP